MTQLVQTLIDRIRRLPEAEQDRLARTLLAQLDRAPQPPERAQPRTPGLGKGTVTMTDDFDDPLPDGFWLGEA